MHIHRRVRLAVGAVAMMVAAVLLPTAAQSQGEFDCDLTKVNYRPLQGAVGLGEVAKKKKDIEDDEAKERAEQSKDPIPVMDGPCIDASCASYHLYILDHHHAARAWIEAQPPIVRCKHVVPSPPLPTKPADFWREAEKRGWVRLRDKDGNTIAPDALPSSLMNMPDDPYRTLAWMVRKADGYCRALMTTPPPFFAEFLWADWLRSKPALPKHSKQDVAAATDPTLWTLKKKDREAKQKQVLDAALTAAKSSAADKLPGYRGDKPPDYKCPPDPPGGS